jgi:hypothetical protein
MRGNDKERCEHCGKFVRSQQRLTLYDKVDHPKCEDVAICEHCSEKYSAGYWLNWLRVRFPLAQEK